jgi:elongation factor G
MKAYEFDDAGKAKERPLPEEGRDIIDATREKLIEIIAESDDALMEKYFDQGTLEDSDLLPNINRAIAASKLCPVFAVSSHTLVGLSTLLDAIVEYAPAPDAHESEKGRASVDDDGENIVERRYNPQEPFSAYVFRTIADPFAGRINVMKVISGHISHDANVMNSTRGAQERLGALHSMQGKQLDKIEEANAGDIIACVKLRETQTGDTLCDRQAQIVYNPVEYPEAAIAFAIEPKSRADEEKISVALHKILEEDPGLHFTRDAQTKEFHPLRLRPTARRNGCPEVEGSLPRRSALHPPKVPYKETITASAEVQGRHKKQTAGAGSSATARWSSSL